MFSAAFCGVGFRISSIKVLKSLDCGMETMDLHKGNSASREKPMALKDRLATGFFVVAI
jgi:hypothetical protein